jgi:hypothetical protein
MTADERYREAIERIVAKAPPLAAVQRNRLRALLAPLAIPEQRTAAEQAATTPTP